LRKNLFDRNKNINILLAGILSIVVGVGVARFAFTTLLPSMLEDFITVSEAGYFASFNYAGYLSGAIFSVFLKDINAKVKYFRVGMILSILTTLILATTKIELLWYISRVVAGFGSAMVLIIGGALVMMKLDMEDKTTAMGVHFSGIGVSIAVTELISQTVLKNGVWADAWMTLCFVAVVASVYVIYILSFDRHIKQEAKVHKVSKSMFKSYVVLLIFAYFTAGVGFVVQATFFPDIINSLPGLQGYGSLGWLIVGVCGIPSAILWMMLAKKIGSLEAIVMALSIQIVGILIPTFTNDIYLNLTSGVFYGSTFVALVALFMNYGGKLFSANPVIFMGAMTTAYGIGQVSAPLYSVYFIEKTGKYHMSLYITAFIVFLGVVLVLIAKSKQSSYYAR
jgi:predicted MFS family arabinose efflux permease